jgi:hypothetical protein
MAQGEERSFILLMGTNSHLMQQVDQGQKTIRPSSQNSFAWNYYDFVPMLEFTDWRYLIKLNFSNKFPSERP